MTEAKKNAKVELQMPNIGSRRGSVIGMILQLIWLQK
jgi:hypothetical protein